MADNMMRIAGRGADGTAKSIATDDAGKIKNVLAEIASPAATTLQSAQNGTDNGTEMTVAGYGSALFAAKATGTLICTIYWEGTADGTNWFPIPATNAYGITAIKASVEGLYTANVAGLQKVRARCVVTHGSVTIIGVALPTPNQHNITPPHIVLIKSASVTVNGLENKAALPITDISQYAYIFAQVRTTSGAKHSFDVTIGFYLSDGITSINRVDGLDDSTVYMIEAVGLLQAFGDWVDVRGMYCRPYIKNKAADSRTYTFELYGVR